jgi:hypothetical protein
MPNRIGTLPTVYSRSDGKDGRGRVLWLVDDEALFCSKCVAHINEASGQDYRGREVVKG